MRIVIFSHPDFFGSISMPKYANMLLNGLTSRGHQADVATASAFFSKLSFSAASRKWLGYLDQFFLFPLLMRMRLRKLPENTLFVFADHALGPWIPLVKNRPHVVHCHDFLAQRSALGEIPENQVGFTGKIYQSYIRWGFQKADNFISISEKTKSDLHLFLSTVPRRSEVVYNGFNQDFSPAEVTSCRQELELRWKVITGNGYLLHVGGNQFYKNRAAVIRVYSEWRENAGAEVPLILVGSSPSKDLLDEKNKSSFSKDIYFLHNVEDEWLKKFYSGASMLLFPSLDEGFGWPIAEAMASGCPVVTIDKAPMNEVGGKHCFYLPEFPRQEEKVKEWIVKAALVVEQVFKMPPRERMHFTTAAKEHSQKFDAGKTLENLESIYTEIIKSYQ